MTKSQYPALRLARDLLFWAFPVQSQSPATKKNMLWHSSLLPPPHDRAQTSDNIAGSCARLLLSDSRPQRGRTTALVSLSVPVRIFGWWAHAIAKEVLSSRGRAGLEESVGIMVVLEVGRPTDVERSRLVSSVRGCGWFVFCCGSEKKFFFDLQCSCVVLLIVTLKATNRIS